MEGTGGACRVSIKDARAAVAAALEGVQMNGQPVNVYVDVPRQWTLPAIAIAPGDPYLEQTGLNTVTVNLELVAAVAPSHNSYDLDALELMAMQMLATCTTTGEVSPPQYTDLGTTEAATVTVPVVVSVPIK